MKKIVFYLFLILSVISCGKKNTNWQFAGSRRCDYEVLRPNAMKLFVLGQQSSDFYYIDVDVFYKYVEGELLYGIKNDEGSIYSDENIFDNEVRIRNFRYAGKMGILTIPYDHLPQPR